MSYNTNAKVNPFYIQEDEEDPWDDDYGDDEYGDEDYDDEQVMLIHGSAGIKNRKYNDPGAPRRNDARVEDQHQYPTVRRSFSYQDGRYEKHDRHLQHRPQLWKYALLLLTIVGAVAFGSSSFSSKNDGDNVSLSSLIDEMETPNNNDYQIVVLGERHSGTAWMRDRLGECFPHAHVSNHLQRMGYFFQDDEETASSKEEALGKHNHKSKGIIVVHVTLNVYDWLEQMRLSPEYAPDHAGKHEELGHPVPLGWEEFLSKPWTTERPESDLNLANETGPVCQMGFHYNEVVSCSKTEGGIGDPMYELKPGGVEESHPFESVIDLRTAKLQNHHSVLDSWPSVKKRIHVSYETTAQDFQTKLLEEILEFTGWNGGSFTHPNGASPLPCSGNVLPPSLDSSKEMTTEFINYVNDHADWETELRVASYEPWTDEEIAAKGIRPEPSTDGSVEEVEDENKADAVAGEDIDVNVDSDDDSETPQNENEGTTRSDPSPTPPVNESSESATDTKSKDESKEIKENDDNTESSSTSSQNEEDDSDVTTDNSQSTSGTGKGSSSSSSSSEQEQETTEETVEEESPPPPPATKDPSSETKSESPKPAEEEASAHIDESSNQDEDSKETNELSKESSESAESTFNEKEEEELPAASSSDQDEESDTISSALNTVEVASSEEGSDADAASKTDFANEENSNGKEASPSDDKENSTAESKENTPKGEETPDSNSDEKEEETSVENAKAQGNENETEGDGDAESSDQDENEIETESLDSNLEDNGTQGTKSDKNNNDGRQ